MDFKEMKVIWDSQNDQPLYALDQEALHASVRRRGLCIEKCVNIFEIFMIVILMAIAAILVGKRLFDEQTYQPYQIVASAMMLVVAGCAAMHVAIGRFRRRRSEQRFESSLMGDLNKAISQVDYQIDRLKSFHWWFILPVALITALNFAAKGVTVAELFDSTRIWIWPLFAASIVVYYLAIHVELRHIHLPRKRNLESLRDKLANGTAG